MVDLGAHRWGMGKCAADHAPADALREALRAIEAGELEPDHVLVTLTWPTGESRRAIRYLSAGKLDWVAQHGLAHGVAGMIAKGVD